MTPEQLAELTQALNGLKAGFDGLAAEIKETNAAKPPAADPEPPADPVLTMLEGMKTDLTTLRQEQADLKAKLETLEQRPANYRRAPEHGSEADDGQKRDPKGHYS